MTSDEVDAAWLALYGLSELAVRPDDTCLGLDLGSTFAWAIAGSDHVLHTGWYDTVRKGEGGGMRYLRFRRAFVDILKALHPTYVCVENPEGAFRGGSGRVIKGQMGVLLAELEDRSVPYMTCHPGTLKKWATGKGNASKEAMRAALESRLRVG